MKKLIIATVVAFATSLSSLAVDYAYTLVLNLTDGTKVNYLFEDMPIAEMEEDNLKITLASTMESVAYPIADIENMTFTKEEMEDNVILPSENGISFGITPTTLEVFGLEEGSSVTILDASGAILVSAKAGADFRTSVDISNLGNGVYMVKAGKHSFKFIR